VGIGTAICLALAKEGADICFTYWREYDRGMEWGEDRDWPEQLAGLLQKEGVRVLSLEVNLAETASPKALMDEVSAVLGAPAILINNAAYSTHDGYESLDARILDAHYAVNVRGASCSALNLHDGLTCPLEGE
jgi:3-oxoacyl-[acyl-carrier protein] reductase